MRGRVLELLGADWTRMTELIRTCLHSDVSLANEINDGILAHPGKLLRPMISLLLARCCGGVTPAGIRYAAAAELLHNATLIHDDVADDSPQRRGMPTLRSLVGPRAAVLVGDYWLARAVEMMMGEGDDPRALRLLSALLVDMAEGEILQLQKADSCDTDEADYLRIISCKTASLFAFTGETAARSAGAPQPLAEAARAYAEAFGMAFQIRDDILDYCGDELGKPVGQDLAERKITLPLIGALRGSEREDEVRAMVRAIPSHPEYRARIRDFVLERGGIGYARERLEEYNGAALRALESLPASPERDCLAEIAQYNSFRNV